MPNNIHMTKSEKLLPFSFGHGFNSVTICKWWLQMEFLLCFQRVHPSIIIRKRSFDLLKPYWVKKMKDQNVCCCIYHVEMEELKVGFNHMRQKCGLHSNSHCDCESICAPTDGFPISCVGDHATYHGITIMWEAIVCLKNPHFEWHARLGLHVWDMWKLWCKLVWPFVRMRKMAPNLL